MLYRVARSENLVIACAFRLLETSGTADRRIRRRKGWGWGACCIHLLPFGSSSTSLHAVTCKKTAVIMRMLGCARCRKLLTMNCVIHRGLLRYVCRVKFWRMSLANWNFMCHLVCLECRKYTSKYTCERRIVNNLGVRVCCRLAASRDNGQLLLYMQGCVSDVQVSTTQRGKISVLDLTLDMAVYTVVEEQSLSAHILHTSSPEQSHPWFPECSPKPGEKFGNL